MTRAEDQTRRETQSQLKDYGRGLAGGLLFGLPLLLTQEVWYSGFILRPLHIAIFLTIHFVVLLGLVWVAGFKAEEERGLGALSFEAVETLGLALVETAVVLLIFGRLNAQMAMIEMVGKVTIAAIPVSIGVAIATSQMQAEQESPDGPGHGNRPQSREPRRQRTSVRYMLVVGGAAYMAYNFAPVQEMTVIALSMTWLHQLALMALSLAVTFGLVFALEFKGGTREIRDGLLEQPWIETFVSYAISLVIAAGLLFFFGTWEPEDSLASLVNHAIVLGFPSSLGAAAGRLLL